ncbi:MAG TPA: response regulator [Aestuariivirgaceae bacterium]|nr:response regulator [Aestuariivirgaceae bacterium]
MSAMSLSPTPRSLTGTSVAASTFTDMNDGAVVHIVDDDLSLCSALEGLFSTVGRTTRSYRTAGDFLNSSFTDSRGCMLIDIRLPDMNGLAFHAKLAERGVRLPVVMMTGCGDIQMAVGAMKRGAVDFLLKPFRDQEMIDAVLAAIERDRRQRTAERTLSQLQERFATLSPRQQEVMLLVTAGRLNKQVAGDLRISEITAKIHRRLAMRKMGARTLADLVRMAEALERPQERA